MSLLVHLPLNGTLENKGLLGELISTGELYVDSGKFGKALCGGGCKMTAEQTNQVLNNNELSFTFWIYVNAPDGSTNGAGIIFGNSGMVENNNRKFAIYTYSTCNDLHLSWMNDSGVFRSLYFADRLPSYEWTHVAITYKNPEIKVYINGELISSASGVSNSSTFAYETPVIRGSLYRYFNDFRIYNNCLSPKEVKEISKGLIAHYKLDDVGINPNIITNDSPSKWGFGINNGTQTKENYENGVHITYGGDATSYAFFIYKFGTDAINALLPNTQYTCSFSYKSTVDNNINIQNIKTGSATQSLSNTGGTKLYSPSQGWVRIVATVTTNDLANRQNSTAQGLYFTTDKTKAGEYWLKDFKLELGNVSTMYIKDNGYSTTIYDSSGYGNNGNDGTVPLLFYLSSDTPRYDYSTIFDGNSFIGIGKNAKVKDAISVCCWAYMDNWANYSNLRLISCTQSGGWAFFTLSSRLVFYIGTGESSNTYKYAGTKYLSSLSSGWHHFVGTYDGLNTKLYIDGVLDESKVVYETKTPIYYYNGNGIFIGAEAAGNTTTPDGKYFNGKMSDVRIYATALSDDDVKELYNTSAFITNEGEFEGYEFVEDDDEQITKTGLVKSDNFYESEALYLDEVPISILKTAFSIPASGGTNQVGLYFKLTDLSALVPGKKYVVEFDFVWEGPFGESGGTLTINSWVCYNPKEGYSISYSSLLTVRLASIALESSSGTYHCKGIYIVRNDIQNFTNNIYGIRVDYSDGVGKYKLENFKFYPLEQDLDTEQTKIGSNYITSKEFIEI